MLRKIKGSGERFNYSHFMGKMILSIELEVTVRAYFNIIQVAISRDEF